MGRWFRHLLQEKSTAWVGSQCSTVGLLQHGVVSAASLPHSIAVDTSTGAASTASATFPVAAASSRPSRCASRLGFHAFRRAKNRILLLVNMLWPLVLRACIYIYICILIDSFEWCMPQSTCSTMFVVSSFPSSWSTRARIDWVTFIEFRFVDRRKILMLISWTQIFFITCLWGWQIFLKSKAFVRLWNGIWLGIQLKKRVLT